ncbi:DoxX family protein [Fulvivirga sp. RKSG066]|uniref:DoxX family protein n=1 Tax=Fulvivirga aurantia TaxID=2529383 RepID=UPI0012BD7763|nr:DoxX family protein [Fulvivirga aurantia]MTI22024.1 DoxX family protein [Fulvivirga aurantia]
MTNRGKFLMQWVLVILIAFQFLLIGFSKLTGEMELAFRSWNYSSEFMYIIGIVEIASAAGLFFNKTRIFSSALQIMIMIGAGYTHWLHAEYFEILINVGVMGFCFIIIWFEQEKQHDSYLQSPEKQIVDIS